MKKEDFLEILKDYLKKGFSEDEITDIVRDYEEYFVDGAIEGKSEMEIINSLGSPKEIANDLLAEINIKNENKIKGKAENIYIEAKGKFKSGLNKFKVNLNDKEHVKSRKKIKLLQLIITIMLIPFAIGIVASTVGVGAGLIGSLVLAVVGTPFAVSLSNVMPELKMVIIFGFVAYIGFEILAWQLFIALVNLERKTVKTYTRWLKTNQLYIDGSIKKEEKEKYDEIASDEEYEIYEESEDEYTKEKYEIYDEIEEGYIKGKYSFHEDIEQHDEDGNGEGGDFGE